MFNPFISFKFHRFGQSGMYVDFFFKKCAEIFIRNVLVYAAQFFGEKFMIEYWTKLVLVNVVFDINKFMSWTLLSHRWFFLQLVSVAINALAIINIIFIFIL